MSKVKYSYLSPSSWISGVSIYISEKNTLKEIETELEKANPRQIISVLSFI